MKYPPPHVEPNRDGYIVRAIEEWCLSHGLAIRPPLTAGLSSDSSIANRLAIPAPVTVFPSLFPTLCFEQAKSIQKLYNELYARIASDEVWLGNIVKGLADADTDDFIVKLWDIHIKVKKEGYVQRTSLGLFRSDYMLSTGLEHDGKTPELKQVEFNTIASSFGGISPMVSGLHSYLKHSRAYPDDFHSILETHKIEMSSSLDSLAEGLLQAHNAYVEAKPTRSHPLCVLFVVMKDERNIFDQRLLEYTLSADDHPPTFRITLGEVLRQTEVTADLSRALLYRPAHEHYRVYEVSVVYFRAGYSPVDYDTDEAWAARLQLERSAAIKCPTVLTQLAGCKKVQQVLATLDSDDLEHFLSNKSDADSLRRTFARIYPMDEQSAAGKYARKLAICSDSAEKLVLKPQREGGGNNIYRRAIPAFLADLPQSRWPAYILMELIETPPAHNVILRSGQLERGGVISELGIFGCCLWTSKADSFTIEFNSEAGHLVRTKGVASEEGGVAAGAGALDSLLLYS